MQNRHTRDQDGGGGRAWWPKMQQASNEFIEKATNLLQNRHTRDQDGGGRGVW